MTQTSQQTQDGAEDRTLHVALELSKTNWKLAFSDGSARGIRLGWRPTAGLKFEQPSAISGMVAG